MCDEQFQAQSAQLRNGEGFMLAHLHGTQFGAQPVSTADGKQVLTAHSMFTVVTHAFDKVKLRGAFPRALEGKYVDLTLAQWVTYFKLVDGSDKEQPKRIIRAQEHYEMYAQPTRSTHPSYEISADMLREKTSLNMKNRVSASFDMRGTPILVGDAVQGIHFPGTFSGPYLRVPAQYMARLDWKLPETAKLVGSHTYTCSAAQWRELTESGGCGWQTSDMLDGACLMRCGFMRLLPDVPDTNGDSDDRLYTVMLELGTDVPTGVMELSPDSVVLLLPRTATGHSTLVVSAEPTIAAIQTMQNWARKESSTMLVSCCLSDGNEIQSFCHEIVSCGHEKCDVGHEIIESLTCA